VVRDELAAPDQAADGSRGDAEEGGHLLHGVEKRRLATGGDGGPGDVSIVLIPVAASFLRRSLGDRPLNDFVIGSVIPSSTASGCRRHARLYARRVPPPDPAAVAFENALLTAARGPRFWNAPALGPFRALTKLIREVASADPHTAQAALRIIHELHRVYEYARLHDDNWRDFGRHPKRVHDLRKEYLPKELVDLFDLAELMWPILPLVSFLRYNLAGTSWSLEQKMARMYEYAFIVLCTNPRAAGARELAPMEAALLLFCEHIVKGMGRRRHRWLKDEDAVSQLVDAILDVLKSRKRAVARYRGKARTIEEAATRTRRYMQRTIRRTAYKVMRERYSGKTDVPASTLNRWSRHPLQISVESPEHAQQIREEMRDRQTRPLPAGYVSEKTAAQTLGVARSTFSNALTRAERTFGFTRERRTLGKTPTTLISAEQLDLVRQCLPAKKGAATAPAPASAPPSSALGRVVRRRSTKTDPA